MWNYLRPDVYNRLRDTFFVDAVDLYFQIPRVPSLFYYYYYTVVVVVVAAAATVNHCSPRTLSVFGPSIIHRHHQVICDHLHKLLRYLPYYIYCYDVTWERWAARPAFRSPGKVAFSVTIRKRWIRKRERYPCLVHNLLS